MLMIFKMKQQTFRSHVKTTQSKGNRDENPSPVHREERHPQKALLEQEFGSEKNCFIRKVRMYSRLADAAATLTRRSHGYMAAVVGGGIVAYGAHYGLYGTHPFQNSSVPKSSADGDTKKDDAGFHWVQSGTRTQQQFKQELTLGQRLSHFAIWVSYVPKIEVVLRKLRKKMEKRKRV